jgi:hypothetical protein
VPRRRRARISRASFDRDLTDPAAGGNGDGKTRVAGISHADAPAVLLLTPGSRLYRKKSNELCRSEAVAENGHSLRFRRSRHVVSAGEAPRIPWRAIDVFSRHRSLPRDHVLSVGRDPNATKEEIWHASVGSRWLLR